MYTLNDADTELSFMQSKTELKTIVISLFSIQILFHIFTSIYIKAVSIFQLDLRLNTFSPRLLDSFTVDVWLIVFLLSAFAIGYSLLTKAKSFPLYTLIVYPAILMILSLARDVSTLQILLFSSLSCTIVLQFNYNKIKQLQFTKI